MDVESNYARFGSGHSVDRLEDRALVTGVGRYTDDVALEGQAHLVFLRSPYAHARILAIDSAAAAAMPGVLQVITGAALTAAGVQPIPGNPMMKRPRIDVFISTMTH